MDKLRVLAVGAHPDDLELLCGGTLARYAELGHQVVMVHLLNGDKGHYKLSSYEVAKTRAAEAQAAGAVIGAEVLTLGIPDCELVADLATRRRVIDLIRQVRPDVVITHAPNDYMADHTAASRLVCDATFFSTVPLLATQHKPNDKVAPVFFMDTVAGVDFLPTEYVDITGCFETKRQMLSCHRSQLAYLAEHDKIDFLEFMEAINRFRGLQCGVRYAEAFRQYEAWARKAPRRLLP
ncbi:MAG TPA: PIG-L family deacetylase [Phycisphaerae bacterium]|nr:PIG-L family deacetylase [Phycisphaerae bacterium]